MRTAAQIVDLANQIASTPGMATQAGQMLNVVLADLAQTYDLDLLRKTYYFNFNPGLVASLGNSLYGSGPYPLPADYLRAEIGDVFWTLNGVVYPMTPIDLREFDMAVQQAGIQSYPYWFCTDLSLSDNATPVAYVYAPPSGTFPVTVRYKSQPADITAPESSATVPWFPNQSYLITRVAGEMMRIADDDRWVRFLGDGPEGAQGILTRYLKLANDKSNRAQTVQLDGRTFGRRYSSLPTTKTVGW